ncbi:MAG: adenylyl-sulfate kinase, partial [Bacteroidota bacterium]
MADNIHPIYDRIVQRAEREARTGHRAGVIWLTGLSGSGKSTIAAAVERELFERGHQVVLLDGDNVRTGLCGDLGFSLGDRQENIRRIAEAAKLFVGAGAQVLCSFVSPTRAIRALAQDIIGPEDFFEVFVNTPLEVCEARDVKGLYAKARAGEIKGFTGIDSPYEAPEAPFL